MRNLGKPQVKTLTPEDTKVHRGKHREVLQAFNLQYSSRGAFWVEQGFKPCMEEGF